MCVKLRALLPLGAACAGVQVRNQLTKNYPAEQEIVALQNFYAAK
jgi:hypothetical protein